MNDSARKKLNELRTAIRGESMEEYAENLRQLVAALGSELHKINGALLLPTPAPDLDLMMGPVRAVRRECPPELTRMGAERIDLRVSITGSHFAIDEFVSGAKNVIDFRRWGYGHIDPLEHGD